MKQIAISKFKATCLSLLEKVSKTGEPLLVTKQGIPIAQVIPPPAPPRPQTWLGARSGTAEIVGDLIAPIVEEQEWEVLKK